ncbi:hypothetical protein [Asaia spathodeae]|uniref:Uncharacterized protein n=1 Tax=Asaia spathodeae TaxID=657016 RepID=A0ABX2P0L0_9PROT|nr:hypothetical protein [Asaia spathodeae]GBR14579.1 hypothetical protein AA105894_1114 [Asaia spathodeae NBRC 105894]
MTRLVRRLFVGVTAVVTLCSGASRSVAQENYTVHGMSRDALEHHIDAELGERQFDTMPRWHGGVCVDIHGIQDQFASTVFEHLQSVGKSLGLQVSRNCRDPRLFVFFTDQSDALAAKIKQLNPTLFVGLDTSDVFHENKVAATPDEIREFLRPRAVRWLTSSAMRIADDAPPLVMPATNGTGFATQGYASFLSNEQTRRDIQIVLIIVDINRLNNEPWGMLNELLSVVAFAGPHLRTGYDGASLLRFTERPVLQGPTGPMTPYDKSLLSALYALPEGYSRSDAVDWMADNFPAASRSR